MNFYHASSHNFSFPVYEELTKNITNHSNGNLGLWFSTDKSWINGFGSELYEITVDDKDIKILPVSELFRWEKEKDKDTPDSEKAYYKNLRNELLKKYKCVVFEENNGSLAMGIVLDFSVIKEFKNTSNKKMTPS